MVSKGRFCNLSNTAEVVSIQYKQGATVINTIALLSIHHPRHMGVGRPVVVVFFVKEL